MKTSIVSEALKLLKSLFAGGGHRSNAPFQSAHGIANNQFMTNIYQSGEDEKAKARSLYGRAHGDVLDNGTHITTFELDNLRSLVSYDGPYSIEKIGSVDDKKKIIRYIRIAARCNNKTMDPTNGIHFGAINGLQDEFLLMLEEYRKKIN